MTDGLSQGESQILSLLARHDLVKRDIFLKQYQSLFIAQLSTVNILVAAIMTRSGTNYLDS